MNTELARIALLLVMFVGYVAICAWAFAPRNRQRFEAAARMPLETDAQLDAVHFDEQHFDHLPREPRR